MSYLQLTDYERYQIYILLKANYSKKEIAVYLERHISTIYRELQRNTGMRGYRPKQAQSFTDKRRQNAYKTRKLTDEIVGHIKTLIKQELSPEQITGYLLKHKGLRLHHETIYQWVYTNKAQGGQYYKHLRIMSKPYRKRYGHYDKRGKISNRVSIEQRPVIVDKKNRIGDWEGDTIVGKGRKSALLTLVERKSLYTVIAKLDGKHAEPLAKQMVSHMKPFKNQVKTITLDNGLEFSAHQKIAGALDANIYFAHPYASWERGINENTNGLVRQYFPKGTDFKNVTEEQIQLVMDRLNRRPRKTRSYKSPNEIFLGQQADLLVA